MGRTGVDAMAKDANGRSRMCKSCKFGVACPPEILSICSRSFVEGFRKGYKKAKSKK